MDMLEARSNIAVQHSLELKIRVREGANTGEAEESLVLLALEYARWQMQETGHPNIVHFAEKLQTPRLRG